MATALKRPQPAAERSRYIGPEKPLREALNECLAAGNRQALSTAQFDFMGDDRARAKDVYLAGDLALLRQKAVAIVGTREVSDEGYRRASRLARELVAQGIVVVSGLAKGVDTAAHTGAIDVGGRTIAVIGTPLDRAYPVENAALQEEIHRDHLLVSPFPPGTGVFKSNFPLRNRVMAAMSDATVIVEASDSSGTLHQAAECLRLGRWLFITRAVAEDPALTWPARFLGHQQVAVLREPSDIFERILR